MPLTAEYRCDECERLFIGPVWHCLTCGRHNAPMYRSCRECQQECPFDPGWERDWQEAKVMAPRKPMAARRKRTEREIVAGKLHGAAILLTRAAKAIEKIGSSQGEGREAIRRKAKALGLRIRVLVEEVRACSPVRINGT